MQISVNTFEELSSIDLYEILQLRSQVFVVEQNCVYQDMDGKDLQAIHIVGKKNNLVIAYARVFDEGAYFEEASIGRVVINENERKLGYGKILMEAAIEVIQNKFKKLIIKISAQTHLEAFYNSLNFKRAGAGYLEDGIPHIPMIKN